MDTQYSVILNAFCEFQQFFLQYRWKKKRFSDILDIRNTMNSGHWIQKLQADKSAFFKGLKKCKALQEYIR